MSRSTQTGLTPTRILVIEDDEDDFFITKTLLRRARSLSAEVTWKRSFEEGVEALTREPFDVALVDYRLGPHSGLDVLDAAHRAGITAPIILLTGQGDFEVDMRAMERGAADYLVKGSIDELLLERSIRYARERAAQARQIREQAGLLDKAKDAICVYTIDRKVAYANTSAERLHDDYGWNGLFSFDHEAHQRAWDETLRTGEWSGELELTRPDASAARIVDSRWTLVRDTQGNAQSILTISSDISERKQLEAQFLRSQRMESIGRLVGGIAHDLGNLLVPIVLGVRVLEGSVKDDERAMRTVEMVKKSAERGSDMVRQVLAFARGVDGERVLLHPGDIIHETAKIIEETFPSTIELTAEIAEDLWNVVGDATQLQQVLMNLSVNARDAMPEGGKLFIQADNTHLDSHYSDSNLEAKPGPYVRITVTDTGEGIPRSVLDKVFEPFFTTKELNKGTGLGLSTVYSIVRSHGGFVVAYSEVGEGTTFSLYVPADLSGSRAADAFEAPAIMRGSGECILIVDDEPFIRDTTSDLLEDAGYAVCTARDGAHALEVFDQRQPVLILTDLMMPVLDGVELIRALRASGSDVPIVAASGMMGEKQREVDQAGADAFLAKPYSAATLTRTIGDLLAERAAAAAAE
jgi:signal transduction histidine kinase